MTIKLTTSYAISKQLADAGFKNESSFYWVKQDESKQKLIHESQLTHVIEKIPSYDLETILNHLPSSVLNVHSKWIRNFFKKLQLKERMEIIDFGIINHDKRYYMGYCGYIGYDLFLAQQSNESLADTAARLWLILKKKNLV